MRFVSDVAVRLFPWRQEIEALRQALNVARSDLAAAEGKMDSLKGDIARMEASKPLLCCDFCGKSQNDVSKLIAGPKSFICNECVYVSVGIIAGVEK